MDESSSAQIAKPQASIKIACGFAISLVLMSGCTTYSDRLQPARDSFYSGNLDSARTLLEEQERKHRREQDVIQLDRAMIELASGHPRDAEKLLREVRDRF